MIIIKSPLRISLAGGGTDLPGFSNAEGGAVCSFAIDKYVYITAKPLPSVFPFRYKLSYAQTELLDDPDQVRHPILRELIKIHGTQSLDFNSMADLPSGTGMGSSSSFAVGTSHALSIMKSVVLSKEELAKSACFVEIEKLKEPIGKQDQYAAAYGGLNYFQFHTTGQVSTTPLIIDYTRERLFMESLSLFYLGGERQASSLLKEQTDNIELNRSTLRQIKEQAKSCVRILTHGTVKELGELLQTGWQWKKSLSSKVSTPEIDHAISSAVSGHAYGWKLLGAGGSGFLLVCHSPKEKAQMLVAMRNFQHVPFAIEYKGSQPYVL